MLTANTAFDRVTVNDQLLAQANLALDLAQTRYKLGLGSIVEVSLPSCSRRRPKLGAPKPGMSIALHFPCCAIKPLASDTWKAISLKFPRSGQRLTAINANNLRLRSV